MTKLLPIKRQIEILERVEKDLIYYGCESGLCRMIDKYVIDKYVIGNIWMLDLYKYIPSFTRENALLLSKKYGFTKPHPDDDYWWRRGTVKSRLAFVRALLKELKQND